MNTTTTIIMTGIREAANAVAAMVVGAIDQDTAHAHLAEGDFLGSHDQLFGLRSLALPA
jgi:hypothetical protein